MDDPELEAIRQRRMAELMARQGGGSMQGGMDPAQAEEQEAKRAAAEEQRGMMLRSVMTAEARERLSRIALVKPDKARNVENMILAAAQRGQLMERVTEERLVAMLGQISEKEASKTKITIQRRRPVFDEDD